MSPRDQGKCVKDCKSVLPSHKLLQEHDPVSVEQSEASPLRDGAETIFCVHCREPLLPDEPRPPIEGPAVHLECGFRMVCGSVGHQQGRCPCNGFFDHSEDGMTLREAAKASWEYFLAGNSSPR